MSRIGKKPITIPKGVEIAVDGSLITAKGPKGQLSEQISPLVSVTIEGDLLHIELKDQNDEHSNLWGLARALIANMIKGVSEGFEKTLEFSGVGYRATLKGDGIELNLGFSHPIFVKAPEGVTFKVEKNSIQIQGINKATIGQVAAHIRTFRPPEPYKGSGIKYRGEIIRRKAGKKAVAGG